MPNINMPEGYTMNPMAASVYDQFWREMHQLGTPEDFMRQRATMLRDMLATQATQARGALSSQLAARGMGGSGALAAGMGQIQGQQSAAMAQAMPQFLDLYLKQRMGLLGGLLQSGQAGVMQDQPKEPWYAGLGGLIGGGANLFGAMFPKGIPSDRRLKTDIERAGAEIGGLPIYRYRYLWDGPQTRRMGFMADEVQQVVPEAVFQVAGFKAVDYRRAIAVLEGRG